MDPFGSPIPIDADDPLIFKIGVGSLVFSIEFLGIASLWDALGRPDNVVVDVGLFMAFSWSIALAWTAAAILHYRYESRRKLSGGVLE